MEPAAALEALLSPAGQDDPYPLYAALRAHGPYVPAGSDWVVVLGYAECDRVLRDPAFEVDDPDRLDETWPGWERRPAVASFTRSMLFSNDPDHGRVRRLAARAFTARRVAGLRPLVERRADALADRLAAGSTADFMTDFAFALPVAVICDLLGVPASDHAWFRPRVAAVTSVLELRVPEADLSEADAATLELRAYFDRLAAERRARPADDLVSALVAVHEEDGTRLSGDELLANLVLLLAAGFETTTNLLGNGLAVLLDRPAQADALRRRPEGAPAFVEEVLRHDPPVQLTSRTVAAPATVGPARLPRNGTALVLLGAANRDPARFADPDRFDPDRPRNTPLSFGAGAHFCLGAALARLEAQVAFPLLVRRFPGLASAGERERRPRLTLRGYARMPVSTGA